MSITESDLERMATTAPDDLLALIASGSLEPVLLAFAAEYAGALPDTDAVVKTLMPLLGHASPVVREGAVYGLFHHAPPSALKRLVEMASADNSEAVREAASDAVMMLVDCGAEDTEADLQQRIADVRAHIERRVEQLREVVTDPGASKFESGIAIHARLELTEVLRILDASGKGGGSNE